MDNTEFKNKIHDYCFDFFHNRLKSLSEEEESLKQSIAEDTKSSAGDKYETSRERANQELDQVSRKIHESKELLKTLYIARETSVTEKVSFGSLVYTSRGYFFIAIPLGRIVIDNNPVFCISLNSPVGQYIANTQKGDQFTVNGQEFEILGIS